jgi:hypothetical protein
MTTAIINRLKTGSVKSVVAFGDSAKTPGTPYVVVKPEPGVNSDKQNFRIILHRNQGESDLSEKYIFEELSGLFNRHVWLEKQGGGKFRLQSNGDWYGPIGMNDDNTIAYERIFFAPRRL